MKTFTVHKHLVLAHQCEASSAAEALEMARDADEITEMSLVECDYVVFNQAGLVVEVCDE